MMKFPGYNEQNPVITNILSEINKIYPNNMKFTIKILLKVKLKHELLRLKHFRLIKLVVLIKWDFLNKGLDIPSKNASRFPERTPVITNKLGRSGAVRYNWVWLYLFVGHLWTPLKWAKFFRVTVAKFTQA